MRTPAATIALFLVAAPAAADPGFFNMDRQDATSRIGADASYLMLDDGIDGTALRFDVHGQYVAPAGFGFYAALPISYLSASAGGVDEISGTGLGDVELGGLYLPRFESPSFSLALHAGITMPTGSDGVDGGTANAAGIGARITDLALIIPGGVTLRLGASPMFRSGKFFGRIDGGIDLNVARTGEGTVDPLIRLNLAAGVDLGSAALTGELINMVSTDDAIGNDTISVIALGVRGVAGGVRPYAGVSVPLDQDDLLTEVAITAGIDALMQ